MDPENITLANAIEATSDLFFRQLAQHVRIGPMPLGMVSPSTLPLRDLNTNAAQMKHFFDIIYDYDGRVNPDALSPLLRDKAWDELPAPFGLKKPLGVDYLLQVFILLQVNGKHCIVKHIYVTKYKIKASLIFETVYGNPSEVIWGNNAKNTKKALQFMLENLGGIQFRLFSLTPDVKKSTQPAVMEKSEEELEKGFEFIREHGGA